MTLLSYSFASNFLSEGLFYRQNHSTDVLCVRILSVVFLKLNFSVCVVTDGQYLVVNGRVSFLRNYKMDIYPKKTIQSIFGRLFQAHPDTCDGFSCGLHITGGGLMALAFLVSEFNYLSGDECSSDTTHTYYWALRSVMHKCLTVNKTTVRNR